MRLLIHRVRCIFAASRPHFHAVMLFPSARRGNAHTEGSPAMEPHWVIIVLSQLVTLLTG